MASGILLTVGIVMVVCNITTMIACKTCLIQKGMIPDPFEAKEGKDWEVIGNIFDNPELIGETKDGESR